MYVPPFEKKILNSYINLSQDYSQVHAEISFRNFFNSSTENGKVVLRQNPVLKWKFLNWTLMLSLDTD